MSQRFRILIADKIAADGLAPLTSDDRFELITLPGLSREALTQALTDCDAVIVRSSAKIPREVLPPNGRLKVIGRAGVGVDTIDVDAATEHGIAVLNAPAGNTVSAAELTMSLMLALARRVCLADRSMRAGAWERPRFSGTELFGKTLGLIGAGRIGGEVARRAHAFGMKVMVYDPYLNEERAAALRVERVELDDLLCRADVISLHVPLTDATAGLINRERLALCRPTAMLINAARGGVVDEAALYDALSQQQLAGAALDVFAVEPLPADSPLRGLDNLILTPHLGASTEEAQQNVALEIAEAVRAALLDGDLSRAVNAPAVGGEQMRRLRPLLDLAERLGRLAWALAGGGTSRVELRYAGREGEALKPLAASALVGLLSNILGSGSVNFVNAIHLAQGRGIAVGRVRSPAHRDYTEYLEVHLTYDGGAVTVAGTILAERHPRLVRIDDHTVDMIPHGQVLIIRNRDVPGVIGRVGTVLGSAQVNIGEYHQSRVEAGGTALGLVGVDGRLTNDLVDAVRAIPEVLDVRQVDLG